MARNGCAADRGLSGSRSECYVTLLQSVTLRHMPLSYSLPHASVSKDSLTVAGYNYRSASFLSYVQATYFHYLVYTVSLMAVLQYETTSFWYTAKFCKFYHKHRVTAIKLFMTICPSHVVHKNFIHIANEILPP